MSPPLVIRCESCGTTWPIPITLQPNTDAIADNARYVKLRGVK